MSTPTKSPDPDDVEHAFEQLLARLRAELGIPGTPAIPLPPDDAPPPPRPWSDSDDEGEAE